MKDLVGTTSPANYFRGPEAVGGKIFFAQEALTFHSHALNIQTGDTTIRYSDIVLVKPRNTLGIVPNGISVFTRDGFEHKFVVYHRSTIIAFLMSKMIR